MAKFPEAVTSNVLTSDTSLGAHDLARLAQSLPPYFVSSKGSA